MRNSPGYVLPQRSLVSQQDSAMIQRPDVPRSKFSGSWSRKTTFDAGFLVPFMVEEVLPGDHLSYDVTAYIRLSTPLFPLFDNQRVDTFFFFVPNRLVWSNWRRFMGEQSTPTQSIAVTAPTTTADYQGFQIASLWDYFALPTGAYVTSTSMPVSALPFRAYALIYNEWFRDENLIDSVPVALSDGPDGTSYAIQRRGKSHDYFTSALPWPQKFTAPSVPLGGHAPLVGLAGFPSGAPTVGPISVTDTEGNAQSYASYFPNVSAGGSLIADMTSPGNVYADLSSATGVSINQFRQAFLVQQLLERDARGGTRYTELVKSHFGVTSPDARMQRPEYIGGGSSPLNITPVAQTAPSSGLTVGALGAAGVSTGQHKATYASTEHGWIIGVMNVRSEISYQQGLHRMWTRGTRYDYYWPSLAGLGEQAILRREIFSDATANDLLVFGYQERWHEYRTRVSEVTGLFRSGVSGTLDAWHLSQYFSSAPLLNQTFVEDSPPMARVLAAGSLAAKQQYLADIFISRTAVRPIPVFGTPVTLGRF